MNTMKFWKVLQEVDQGSPHRFTRRLWIEQAHKMNAEAPYVFGTRRTHESQPCPTRLALSRPGQPLALFRPAPPSGVEPGDMEADDWIKLEIDVDQHRAQAPRLQPADEEDLNEGR